MKHSIAKIFQNLNLTFLIIFILSLLTLLFVIEQSYSYKKINILNTQKQIIQKLFQEQMESKDIDIISYNDKIATLNNLTEKNLLRNSNSYLSIFIINDFPQQETLLRELQTLIKQFDTISRKYFDSDDEMQELQKETVLSLETKYNEIVSQIERIILSNLSFDEQRFSFVNNIFILLFIIVLFSTFWFRLRLNMIHRDLLVLYSPDVSKATDIKTQEVDAIALRLKRKGSITDNPAMLDPVTGICNNKGMIQSFSERKTLKDNNFTSVAVLEIDNFSKSKRAFSQEFTQAILKKVAYAISLHQQATDIIARSDYNQFTLIFSRPSKEQLYKHTELVRQSVAELRLVSPQNKRVAITVTGGFVNKAENTSLEDSIRRAKNLLKNGQHLGSNRIIQQKDIPNTNI